MGEREVRPLPPGRVVADDKKFKVDVPACLGDRLEQSFEGNLGVVIECDRIARADRKRVGLFGRNTGCGQFFEKHRPFRFAADDAQKWELAFLPEDFFQDSHGLRFLLTVRYTRLKVCR